MTLSSTPTQIFRASDVRAIDDLAINQHGFSGFDLMTKAAQFTLDCILQHRPSCRALIIFCGVGNNAGDGYLIAQLAFEKGLEAKVFWLADPAGLSGDAKRAWQTARDSGIVIEPWREDLNILAADDETIIVDALLGTGINRDVSGHFALAIEAINESPLSVISVDIPSGLDGNIGRVRGMAIEADITATFIAHKLGNLTHEGPQHAGEVLLNTLGVEEHVYPHIQPVAKVIDGHRLIQKIPKRHRNSHKGKHGHALLIGGDIGFAGAITLAASACARMGPGLTSIATRAQNVSTVTANQPEVMTHAVESYPELKPLIAQCSLIVIGPGLGQDAWGQQMLFAALETELPMIVDADALNLIARKPTKRDNWVLTPHPGEAARMLNSNSGDIQADRTTAIEKLNALYGGYCLLKGAGTLISHQDAAQLSLCREGNPGMSNGGMGDVLSGLLGGLLSQEMLSVSESIDLGVWLHSRSADILAKKQGERGLLAADLIPTARELLNQKTR